MRWPSIKSTKAQKLVFTNISANLEKKSIVRDVKPTSVSFHSFVLLITRNQFRFVSFVLSVSFRFVEYRKPKYILKL